MVVVCKYVGTPPGSLDHIVIVNENSLNNTDYEAPPDGDSWTDAQGQTGLGSVAIRYATENEQANDVSLSECPGYNAPDVEIQVPTAPPVEDPCNEPGETANNYFVVPDDTEQLDWTLLSTGDVTAAPQDGYVFVGDSQLVIFELPTDSGVLCETPPPTDVCTNLPGVQVTVPAGYTETGGICTQVPPPPTDACTNIEGVQTEVPDGYQAEDGVCTLIEPEPEDVCTNIDGVQSSVPEGYAEDDGVCIEIEGEEAEDDEAEEPEVKPAEEERPKPAQPVNPAPVVQPDQVAGTEAALPTAVDAGLAGPTGTGGSNSPLGQSLMAAGLVLIALAGVLKVGRRERGVHEA